MKPLITPVLLGWIFSGMVSASAKDSNNQGYFDPATPSEMSHSSIPHADALPFWEVTEAIRKTVRRIAALEKQLASLPPTPAVRPVEAFGAHSEYLAVEDLPVQRTEPLWRLDFSIRGRPQQGKYLVLVPAIDNRVLSEIKSYGFPKRFTIEMVLPRESRTFVNWRDQDFPYPGNLPVIFKVPEELKGHFRINVYEGVQEGGIEYLALGKIMILGAAQEFKSVRFLKSMSEYQSIPYWSKSYLIDGRFGLGLPLFNMTRKESDFLIKSRALGGECILRVDLGSPQRFHWINLFPALPAKGINIPGYGFPQKIRIEGRADSETDKPIVIFENTAPLMPGNNLVRLPGSRDPVRWLDFIFSDFPKYGGVPTFSLGEIQVMEDEMNLLQEGSLTMISHPDEDQQSLSLLNDNQVAGQELQPLSSWLHGLAARKPILWELGQLGENLVALRGEQQRLRRSFTWIGIVGVSCGVLAFGAWIRVNQRREHNQLRKQINRDLHDNIGSAIAGISLASELMIRHTTKPEVLDGVESIRRSANSMRSAVREVLWFTDTSTDTLPRLVEHLVQIAKQQVPASCLILKSPLRDTLPKKSLHIRVKRDLVYFWREALSNALQHAKASEIRAEIEWSGGKLRLCVQDNGVGFDGGLPEDGDATDENKHYGLESLRERAQHLRANLILQGCLGSGTRVELTATL